VSIKKRVGIVVCLGLAIVAGQPVPRLMAMAQQEAGASPDVIMIEARRVFEALDYERAVTTLDRVVGLLEARSPLEPAPRALLSEAYELRARARFGLNDRDGARADFKSLLAIDPGHLIAAEVSPNVVAIFVEMKKAMVGTVNLAADPADADLQIDGVAVARHGGAAVTVLAGPHLITARKPGYRPASESISIAAGTTVDLSLTLERVSATINLVTVPSEVEVVLDGVSRGTTAPGPPPAEYDDVVRSMGVAAATVSRPFMLADIPNGAHLMELKKDCYVRAEQRFEVQKPADYRLQPIKMVKAVGTVTVKVTPGSVFIDGQSRGAAPVTADDICEGPHTVEVRSAAGRYVKRLDIRTGETVPLQGAVRPAVAVLSTTGLPEGLRGGPDLRLAVERVFQNARTVTVYAAPQDQVDQALTREKLSPAWLSFDTAKRPIGDAAANITAAARRDLSARMTRNLDVQAIASVTVPSREDRSALLVTFLAAGSGEPDTIRIALDDPDSVARAINRLDSTPAFFHPSAAMQVADVLDVVGAVVISVDPAGPAATAGLVPGDIINSVNNQPVADASRFAALLSAAKVDDTFALGVRDKTAAARRAELRLVAVPQLIAMVDETLLFNKLLLDFRARLLAPSSPLEESVARLNLGVALMRVGNWADARAELDKVQLPNGPGVSNGTVQYLLGLAHEAMGQPAEAEAALRAAAASTGALLTSEGPAVKDLADQKLVELARRARPARQ
jgi:tetratricopeptide (TPR) repeat protein